MGEVDEEKYKVPLLGLLQTKYSEKSGRIIVYGDSNCIDGSHLENPCYWMLDAMLEYTSTSHLPSVFKDNQMESSKDVVVTDHPARMEGNRLYRYAEYVIELIKTINV